MEAEQAVTLLCESALSVRFRDAPPVSLEVRQAAAQSWPQRRKAIAGTSKGVRSPVDFAGVAE